MATLAVVLVKSDNCCNPTTLSINHDDKYVRLNELDANTHYSLSPVEARMLATALLHYAECAQRCRDFVNSNKQFESAVKKVVDAVYGTDCFGFNVDVTKEDDDYRKTSSASLTQLSSLPDDG